MTRLIVLFGFRWLGTVRPNKKPGYFSLLLKLQLNFSQKYLCWFLRTIMGVLMYWFRANQITWKKTKGFATMYASVGFKVFVSLLCSRPVAGLSFEPRGYKSWRGAEKREGHTPFKGIFINEGHAFTLSMGRHHKLNCTQMFSKNILF